MSTVHYIPVVRLEEIPEGQTLAFQIEGRELLVCHYLQQVYVIENRCPHQNKELTNAKLKNGRIICPFHGYAFYLQNGENALHGVNCRLTVFPSRCQDGVIEIFLESA